MKEAQWQPILHSFFGDIALHLKHSTCGKEFQTFNKVLFVRKELTIEARLLGSIFYIDILSIDLESEKIILHFPAQPPYQEMLGQLILSHMKSSSISNFLGPLEKAQFMEKVLGEEYLSYGHYSY